MVEQEQAALEKYRELTRFMAEALLEDGVEVTVDASAEEDQLRLGLHVPEAHRGRVIGKGGRIARAMRTLLSQAAVANHKPVVLDIID